LHDQLAATTDTAGITGTMIVDIHLNGTTIMTTNKLDIETTEKGTETAVIPVGTFTGTAGSIPFSNGTSIVEDNANLFWDDVNNRLGLGTTDPSFPLHVYASGFSPVVSERSSSSTGSSLRGLELHRYTTGTAASGIGTEIAFRVEDDGGTLETAGAISGILTDVSAAGEEGDIVFEVTSNSGLVEGMRIKGISGGSANVGIGVSDPDAKLVVNGYTKLGSDAPAIKMKKLTGTTGGTEGDITNITHGLTVSKIIGCQVLVTQNTNNLVPPAFTAVVEHEYDFFVLASVVRIVLTATNSGSIINGAITVLLTYEN
ncbi:hypothetical protein LCGC14_2198470, partial [marine sediment metagenome]